MIFSPSLSQKVSKSISIRNAPALSKNPGVANPDYIHVMMSEDDIHQISNSSSAHVLLRKVGTWPLYHAQSSMRRWTKRVAMPLQLRINHSDIEPLGPLRQRLVNRELR